jgi:transcriptional regulator with XRE-family HTH domain
MIATAEELGQRIRELRVERRLTLKQVEKASGLSAAHLSEIERGQASPTIGALERIARALGKDPPYFVERHKRPEVSHQPKESGHRLTPSAGLTAETLTSGTPGGSLFAYRLHFSDPAAELAIDPPPIRADGLYFVRRGVLDLDLGGGPMRLTPGDAVQATLSRPHRLRAASQEPAEVLAALTIALGTGGPADRGLDPRLPGLVAMSSANDGVAVATARELGPDPAQTTELGPRIRLIRGSLGLTLKDIEGRGGISATHVSGIERGKASPTVVALGRIAEALGLPAAVLLDPPMLPDVSAVSEAERGGRTLQWGAATLESLTEPIKGGTLGAYILRLPVGPEPALTHRHEGEEWLTVLSGVAEVRLEDARYLLLEGDSLHFRAHGMHSYANPSSTPAVLLTACRPRIQL